MKLGHWTAIAVCLLALSLPSSAQLQIDAQLGFDPQTPLVRANTWVPVTATLRNTGPDTDGVLRIRTRGADPKPLLKFEYPLSLPKNSTKQIRDAIFIRPKEDGVIVEFVAKRKVVTAVSLAFQFADPSLLSVLIVGEEDWVRSLKAQMRDDPRVLRPLLYAGKLESLAEQPHAYDGIDTILLDQVEWTRVFPVQAAALRGYVERGGNLVVSSGRAGSGLNNSSLAEWLPVAIGPTEPNAQQVRLFPNVVPIRSDRHLLVSRAAAKPGSSLHVISTDANNRPVIAESDLGLGRITFLAFQLGDPVLRDWSGRLYLWRFLFARKFTPLVDTRADAFAQPMQDTVQSNTLLAIPTSGQVGLLLAAYVAGLIPLNHLFWRLVKRPLWAWVTLPVFSVAIGVIVIVNERVVTRGNLALTEISVLHSQSGHSTALADTFLSLQSPYAARFGVSSTQSVTAWLPVAVPERDRAFAVRTESASPALQFDVLRKDVAAFRAVHAASFGQGIEVRAELEDQTIRGQVFNRTGLHFIRSGLVGPSGGDAEFAVIANATTNTNVKLTSLSGSLKSLEETLRNSVLPQIDTQQRILFWALADNAPLDVVLRDQGGRPTKISRESRWSLVLCEAPFRLGDGRFEIAPDHWRIRVVRASVYNEREYLGLDARKVPNPFSFNEIVFAARPDMALPVDTRLEIEGFKWQVECSANADDLKRELFNFFANTWDIPPNELSPTQAVRYLHPRTGVVLIRISGGGQKQLSNISLRVTGQRTKPESGT